MWFHEKLTFVVVLYLSCIFFVLILAGCSYTDISVTENEEWRLTSINFLWGREVILPNGLIYTSKTNLEGLADLNPLGGD